MTTKEQIEAIAIESSRDFDAWVAEHVFGWKEMKVPADASGENACVILAPPQGVHKDYAFPPKGKLHRGFLSPKFSSDVRAAMDFANEVGIRHIPLTAAHNPLAICRIAMRAFRAPEAPKGQTETRNWIDGLGIDDAKTCIAIQQYIEKAHAAGVREGIEKFNALYKQLCEIETRKDRDPHYDFTQDFLRVYREIRNLIKGVE